MGRIFGRVPSGWIEFVMEQMLLAGVLAMREAAQDTVPAFAEP
jgi:hypothetical protein